MNFNLTSSLLSVSSDSSTIHIYRLQHQGGGGGGGGLNGKGGAESSLAAQLPSPVLEETASETASVTSPPPPHSASGSGGKSLGKRSYFIGKSLIGGVGGYMPRSVSEMWDPERDFAHIKLRGNHGRTVVAMSR